MCWDDMCVMGVNVLLRYRRIVFRFFLRPWIKWRRLRLKLYGVEGSG